MENRLKGGNHGIRKNSKETMIKIKGRDDGDLEQSGSHGGGLKLSLHGCFVKIELWY